MNLPEVDIIGTGNLAANLAPALEQNGFIVNNITVDHKPQPKKLLIDYIRQQR